MARDVVDAALTLSVLPGRDASDPATGDYPSTQPKDYAGELPIGVSFFAGRWSDATVLALAAAYERATPVRHAPRYLPTVSSS